MQRMQNHHSVDHHAATTESSSDLISAASEIPYHFSQQPREQNGSDSAASLPYDRERSGRRSPPH